MIHLFVHTAYFFHGPHRAPPLMKTLLLPLGSKEYNHHRQPALWSQRGCAPRPTPAKAPHQPVAPWKFHPLCQCTEWGDAEFIYVHLRQCRAWGWKADCSPSISFCNCCISTLLEGNWVGLAVVIENIWSAGWSCLFHFAWCELWRHSLTETVLRWTPVGCREIIEGEFAESTYLLYGLMQFCIMPRSSRFFNARELKVVSYIALTWEHSISELKTAFCLTAFKKICRQFLDMKTSDFY